MKYTCPMHPEIVSDTAGKCPICHVDLVSADSSKDSVAHKQLATPKTPWTDWLPLAIVIGYILGLSVVLAKLTEFSFSNLLTYSMGFFFVFFSLFKLINLSGFAMGYSEYDIISKRWYKWGYIYPFVELGLGVFYLLAVDNPALHIFTIVMSVIVCISVGIKLAKHEVFQCACLGTVLKVPLTKVSLIEYGIMGSMAIYMLVKVI